MATPGELIRICADALCLSEVTVAAHYRNLREAGLVTKGGRGRSAPKSTVDDAAMLLVALLGAESGVQAAEAVRWFADLGAIAEFEIGDEIDAKQTAVDLSKFADVPFTEAVARLLSDHTRIIAMLEH